MITKRGKHLEITYLVNPEQNDNAEKFKEAVLFIKNELGKNISLHITRYFPCHKLKIPPTSIEKLKEL